MLQLLQTWETKFFSKQSFSGNKKLFISKEVEEFLKMCQKSNSRSVRDKNHGKSMLECTGNTSASWPPNQQRYHYFAQSKTRILHSILHRYFKGSSFKWSSTLFMLTSDGSGWLTLRDKMHYWWLLLSYSQFPVVKKEIQSTLSKTDTFGTGPKCPS